MERDSQEAQDLLDYPLIRFSKDNPADWWTIGDAVRGVQIFGGIGSGKSSGSGKTLAYSFLKNGFGGIVLTGKVDETITWLEYADKMGRLDDVIVFGAERPEPPSHEKDEFKKYRLLINRGYHFNPLDYEMNREGHGAGDTDNIVSLFTSIIKAGDRISGGGEGSSDDPFWDRALQRCIKSAVDLLKLARKDEEARNDFVLTVNNIARIVRHSMRGGDIEESYVLKCLESAHSATLNESQKSTLELVQDYFLTDLPAMPENTRGSILESFYAFANPFRSGTLADYFAAGTSEEIKPEATFNQGIRNGKIILLDFPVKEFMQVGIYAQAIYKRMWQQAVERRKVEKDTKPVFIWVDEAQYFLNEDDMLFQTTARSSRACTVMLSQNISNYYATIGGKNAKERVDSLLGNLSTKIFHANNDYVTNQWSADTIGKTFQAKMKVNVGATQSTSLDSALHYQIEPQVFTVLKNGRRLNEYQVEGIVTVAGKQWSNGKNFLRTYFYQKDDDLFTNGS